MWEKLKVHQALPSDKTALKERQIILVKPWADPAFVGPGTSTLRRSYLRKSMQEKDAIPTLPSIAVGGTLCHQEPPSSGCISVLGNAPVHEQPQTAPACFLQTVTGLSSRPCEGSMALSPGTATHKGFPETEGSQPAGRGPFSHTPPPPAISPQMLPYREHHP